MECCTQLSPTKQRRQDRSLFRTIIKSLKGQFSYPPEPHAPPPHILLGTQTEDSWETAPGDTENKSKIKLKLAPAGVAEGCGLGWSFVCLHVSFGELTADRGRSLLGLLCPDSRGWRRQRDSGGQPRGGGPPPPPPHPRQSLRLHSQSRRGC